jgi:hypothetical protein
MLSSFECFPPHEFSDLLHDEERGQLQWAHTTRVGDLLAALRNKESSSNEGIPSCDGERDRFLLGTA